MYIQGVWLASALMYTHTHTQGVGVASEPLTAAVDTGGTLFDGDDEVAMVRCLSLSLSLSQSLSLSPYCVWVCVCARTRTRIHTHAHV